MINVGVLGATGAVGQRFVELLADHPWFNLSTLAASERSAGQPYGKIVNWRLETPFPEKIAGIKVTPTSPKAMKGVDLVFSLCQQILLPVWRMNLQMRELPYAATPAPTVWNRQYPWWFLR